MVDFLAQGWLYAHHFRNFVPTTTNNDPEVEEREAACHSVGTYLDQLRNFNSPDKDKEVSCLLDLLLKTEQLTRILDWRIHDQSIR
jgi:hypothetical protein